MQKYLLVFFLRKIFVRGLMALLDYNLVNLELDSLSLNDLLFHRILGNQPIDKDLLLLTDSMGTVHRLQIDLWIPVRIIQDYVVCRM